MPTYEYVCKGCGHALELFQQMTAKPIKKCPKCGANKLQRQIGTGGGIIFKGSGFYATDYKKSSASPPPPPSDKSSCKPTGCEKPDCPKPGKSDD